METTTAMMRRKHLVELALPVEPIDVAHRLRDVAAQTLRYRHDLAASLDYAFLHTLADEIERGQS